MFTFLNERKADAKLLILTIILCCLIGTTLWLPKAYRHFILRLKYEEQFLLSNFDFNVYYVAGKAFSLGYNPYLDNRHLNSSLVDSVTPNENGFAIFNYPPTLLPLFSLLAKLEYDAARICWAIFYLTFYIAAFFALFFHTKKDSRISFFAIGALLTLTSRPLLFHIILGQIDLFIVGIVMLSYIAYSRNYYLLSAFLLALITHIKIYPIVLLIYFVLFFKNIRYLIYFILSFFAIIAVSLLAIPFDLYLYNIAVILPMYANGVSAPHSQSLVKFVADMEIIPKLIISSGFVLFALFVWHLRKKINLLPIKEQQNSMNLFREKEMLFFMNILVMLLFAPRVWQTAYVWIILPLALILTEQIKHLKIWYLGLMGLAVFMMNFKIFYSIKELSSTNMYGNILMLICLIIYFMRKEWVIEKT